MVYKLKMVLKIFHLDFTFRTDSFGTNKQNSKYCYSREVKDKWCDPNITCKDNKNACIPLLKWDNK